MAARVIKVPLKGSVMIYEINLNKLPKHETVGKILKDAKSKMFIWLKVAIEYSVKSNVGGCIKILKMSLLFANLDYRNGQLDKIKGLDMLALCYYQIAQRQKVPVVRNEYITKFKELYKSYYELLVNNELHYFGRVYWSLLKDKLKSEMKEVHAQFDLMLERMFNNITPSKFPSLCSAYKRKAALKTPNEFLNVPKMDPKSSLEDKLTGAYAHLKYGSVDNAKRMFDKIIKEHPYCTEALFTRAAINFNTRKVWDIELGVGGPSKFLQIIHNGPPKATQHLADTVSYDDVIKTTEDHVSVVYELTRIDLDKSMCLLEFAKFHHSQHNWVVACHYYLEADECAPPNYILPMYGLGHLYINKSRIVEAIECFEKVIIVEPNNHEVLMTLSKLYLRTNNANNVAKARLHLIKLTQHYPNNDELWCCLGKACENTHLYESIMAYNKAIYLIRKIKKQKIGVEMHNTMGALYYKAQHFKESLKHLKKALAFYTKLEKLDKSKFHDELASIKYNIGRNYEQLNMYEMAHDRYMDIVNHYPTFTDVYLRLGCNAFVNNEQREGYHWFNMAIDHSTETNDVLGTLKKLKFFDLDWDVLGWNFDIIRNPSTLNDPKSVFAKGNDWLQYLYGTLEVKNRGKFYNLILEFLAKVLKSDVSNVWAATGLGYMLVYDKHNFKTTVIRTSLSFTSDSYHHVWINLAHTYYEQKQFSSAIKLYRYSIKQLDTHENIDETYLRLGDAYLRTKLYEEGKNAFLKAIQMNPQNIEAMFNVALALEKLSNRTIIRGNYSLESVKQAKFQLGVSKKFLMYLCTAGKYETNGSSTINESRILLDYVAKSDVRIDNERQFLLDMIQKQKLKMLEKISKMKKNKRRKNKRIRNKYKLAMSAGSKNI